jgi:hypothetical protein
MGVILFLMVVGSMPFQYLATIQDPLFGKLCRNESDSYWQVFEYIKTPQIDEERTFA